jgi:imidazolonepropionase
MTPDIVIANARLLTLADGGPAPRRGRDLANLGIVDPAWIHLRDGRIVDIGEGEIEPDVLDISDNFEDMLFIDADGRVVMPAFVDCHTHACWAGSRLDEFEMKVRGAAYLDILKAGGGIMSTVRATRAATEHQLLDLLLRRLHRMMILGTGTVEVKSGYGLTPDSELTMLRAIRAANGRAEVDVVPTFLGAHAIDPSIPDFINLTIDETLPAVAREFPRITCDAYCEDGAWNLPDTRRYFEQAQALGCPIRVHTDQFHSLGATRLAIEMGAVSVDHLEAATPADVEHIARSNTIAVALPCACFHLDCRYAPARAIIDAGGALAIATNSNPGSAPTPSMPFAIALACRHLHLSPAEAIAAATINAAAVLRMDDEIGSLEIGKRADLQILDTTDERDLGYEFAGPGPDAVILRGKVVHQRSTGNTSGG